MKILQSYTSELNKLYIFELPDKFTIEAVFYRGDTLCVSTQVGCAIRCPFCASGRYGLYRNLSWEEIFGQYDILKDTHPIKRIAIAGIGEPLMNFEEVLKAFWKFKELGLKVSFYTTGFPVKYLKELINLPHNGVTISIHSTNNTKRKMLLPHAGPIGELVSELRKILSGLPNKKRKKISLAYLLIKGINDSIEDIIDFAKLVKELSLSATLLQYNQTSNLFNSVDDESYEEIFLFLRSLGIRVTLSTRFRKDKIGGCGTLSINRSL